jgi:MutS-like protein
MPDPRAEYERRLAHWRARIAELDRRHLFLSNTRLALAGIGAILAWQTIVRARIAPWWLIGDALLFAAIAVVHALLLQRVERARRAAAVYLRGLDRLDDRWAGTGRDGARFLDGHPYARDLDLFGRASLFERLNTTRTEAGETTLADFLRAGAPAAEVRARQAAVAELRPMLAFREDVAVLAAESPVGRTGVLATWAASPPAAFPRWLGPALAATAATTAALAVLAWNEMIATESFVFWTLATTGVAAIWRKRVDHVLHAIETPERDLGLLSLLLHRVEIEPFRSPRLDALRETLLAGGAPPSRLIARLRSLVSWADSTHNLLFGPIAFVLLVKPQIALAIDRWHRAHGGAIADWLRTVGEVEALSALAAYAYERPRDPFPDLVDTGRVFDASAAAHPLIPDAASVPNDVRLGDEGPRAIVVSGSNMSGKSTLLRTVGVNVVLALAGAPVRAASVRLSPLLIGATLRIDDSLQEGHSRFYTEILRIRDIVAAARGPVPLLFLLDEILHGTNSHDRRIGAEAVVRALVDAGAIGLVTTHDLALTELPSTLDRVANAHFEDRLVDGRMAFDYRMRPGVVEHSNALALMRAIGLDV